MHLISALSFVIPVAAGASSAALRLQCIELTGRRSPAVPSCFCPIPGQVSSRGQRNFPASPVSPVSICLISVHGNHVPCSFSSRCSPLCGKRLASADGPVAARHPEEVGNDEDDDGRLLSDAPPSKRDILVSSSIDLPFPAEVAFDAFADLPRQPTWSPWLRSVEYVDDLESASICEISGVPLREAKWTMGYRGLRFSWNAVSTVLERPGRIDWESTSGLKNFGTVTFVDCEQGGDGLDSVTAKTKMTLSMKFRAPRVVASLLRRSDSIAALMEEKMLKKTLHLFREVVIAEDLSTSIDGQLCTEENSQWAQ